MFIFGVAIFIQNIIITWKLRIPVVMLFLILKICATKKLRNVKKKSTSCIPSFQYCSRMNYIYIENRSDPTS